ncbi:MAG TPA: DUF4262 domain-containing protein, partial [Micropepsaceae bacterium]|nr:DUF4262 domain-containing protein [Micropepsaceae bacterium]
VKMRTALDAPTNALDAHEQKFVSNIRKHGWCSTSVFPEDKSHGFTYTTGFWVTLGCPEVILFSLDGKKAHDILWDLFRDTKARGHIAVGKYVPDILANGGAYFFPVSTQRYPEYLGWSRWFYAGDDFPCLQLVWGDTRGVLPWQSDFEGRFENSQPDLSSEGWIKHLTQ